MTREIYNTENIIDSRDVIERIRELEETLAEGHHDVENIDESVEELKDELASLKELAEQGKSGPDWMWGDSLIRESYFEEYARDMAQDLGLSNSGEQWPYNCIDWELAARELQQDFMPIEYDGVTYWIRA